MPSGKILALQLLRIALGLFFLIVGIIKLRDLNAFTEDIFNYQILFPPYDGYAAYFVAWLEVIAGLAVIIGRWALRGSLLLIAGMLLTFITALSIAAAKGLNINCGCFGSSDEPTNFPLHIGMNLALFVLTGILFWKANRRSQSNIFGKSKLSLPR
ncbi:MAG: DoxX family protein [Roseibacillus sp.]